MHAVDLQPLYLSIKLAALTSMLLLVICIPLAWWLVQQKPTRQALINALCALPLVLPPTVIGFYLLLLMSPGGWLGQLNAALGLEPLSFSFRGLVLASMVYSLPFALQPLQSAFSQVNKAYLEAAACMGANAVQRFIYIVLPLARNGIYSALILSFAHTMGEFGVVLMIGGNIDSETRVLSIAIYDHVEALEYTQAALLSTLMLVFSLLILSLLYLSNGRKAHKMGSL
ncbi:molybdate ABC transporter permease subunit [Agaribacterium haliotis]|uniref:molybdate ABC transporter permease subunit n=1 Tax=Agaribacterium haliotis TaxID=2013869 RepID=UPI000BB56C5A|nr:molybdate ABC transporter permease subunit [Agaribacterium haliotis]